MASASATATVTTSGPAMAATLGAFTEMKFTTGEIMRNDRLITHTEKKSWRQGAFG
jgi:hypothetical protein